MELTEIIEVQNEESIVVGPDGEKADVLPPGQEIRAERFDFTFEAVWYKHQIHKDEYGERLNSGTREIGRIVSKDCIKIAGVHVEEEEELYINGQLVQRTTREAPIIPI